MSYVNASYKYSHIDSREQNSKFYYTYLCRKCFSHITKNFICAFCTITKMHITNKMPQCTKENDDTQVNIFFFFQDNFFFSLTKNKEGKRGYKNTQRNCPKFFYKDRTRHFSSCFYSIPKNMCTSMCIPWKIYIYSAHTYITYFYHITVTYRYHNYTTHSIQSFPFFSYGCIKNSSFVFKLYLVVYFLYEIDDVHR